MSPTGPRFPTTASSASGANGAWTNPTNVEATDHAYASGNISTGGSQTNNLLTSGYGFAIPSFAIIDGITIDVVRYGVNCETNSIQIMKASSLAGTAKTSTDIWQTVAEELVTYGSVTDLWGTTWAPSDINNSGFGVALSAINTHSGGTAFVDSISVTVYWHTAPATIPKIKYYIHKVYDKLTGDYLGNLPNVTSEFEFSQDINTGGSQITVTCAASADTSALPNSAILDESGANVLDEAGNNILDQGAIPIVGLGTSNTLISNGNLVVVYEYSYYYPNGKIMFQGIIEHWEAQFGGQANSDLITIFVYSTGTDMDNYLVGGGGTNILDQSYTTDNQTESFNVTIAGSQQQVTFGQNIPTGATVTNISAVTLKLYLSSAGFANVTLKLWSDRTQFFGGTPLASKTLTINAIAATHYQFVFANPITVVGGSTLFWTVTSDNINLLIASDSTTNAFTNANAAGNYNPNFANFWATLSETFWYQGYTTSLSTTVIFNDADPSTDILVGIMGGYTTSGGLVTYDSTTIEETGLSVSYTFNTNTVYESLQAILTISPNGFYYYVDLGQSLLYFKKTNETADIVLTKGKHIDQLNLIATIEQIINEVYFTGGSLGSNNLFTFYKDPSSVARYGPHIDRPSNNLVTDLASAAAIGTSELAEKKDEQFSTIVTIIDGSMDTTLIKPGLVVGFNGFGTFVDGLLLQIVHLDYKPSEVTCTLGILPRRLHSKVEQVVRGFIGLNTVGNPSSPS